MTDLGINELDNTNNIDENIKNDDLTTNYRILDTKIIVETKENKIIEKHYIYITKKNNKTNINTQNLPKEEYYNKYSKEYYILNKEKVKKYTNEYEKERCKIDEEYKLRRNKQKLDSYYKNKELKKKLKEESKQNENEIDKN